ncbi:hypothetical protein L3Q82_007632 [Scortum barcoo]|uniref:Uncharacterized protein n=1 Tax=Scortum barcoo TaxID=214431 RepID=A0ACB8WRT0_9TELE|nr:hypothetical protein L3Q82_007632 [Scortum barcoo]
MSLRWLSHLFPVKCQAGCRETGLCCTGRDPTCISTGWRSDRSYGTCYCDQACVSMLDCCHDYETACPGTSVMLVLGFPHLYAFTLPSAVSCVVSEWTSWSGCAESCRATVRRRSRTILQEPLNAGKPCPHLEEHAGCAEYWSHRGHCHNSLDVILSVLHLKMARGRVLLFSEHFTAMCVLAEARYDNVLRPVPVDLSNKRMPAQHSAGPHTQWMQYLREGHHVCVECQPPALAAGQTHCTGDGEEKDEGRKCNQDL